MNREFDLYIDRVMAQIRIRGRKSRQIREDLYASLVERQQLIGENDPYMLLGDPNEVALEFIENLGLKKLPFYYHGYGFEYKSKITLFGIPLIHINYNFFGVAKGIIAIGNVALGLLAIGGISIGLLSIGGLSLALFLAFGGVSISGLLSAGGVALSTFMSLGGVAIANYLSIGGYAIADIAIGGVAKGVIAIFNQSGSGAYLFKTPVDVNQVMNTVHLVHPKIWGFISFFIQAVLRSFA